MTSAQSEIAFSQRNSRAPALGRKVDRAEVATSITREHFSHRASCATERRRWPMTAVLTAGERREQFAMDVLMTRARCHAQGEAALACVLAGRQATGATPVRRSVAASDNAGSNWSSPPPRISPASSVSTKPRTASAAGSSSRSAGSSSMAESPTTTRSEPQLPRHGHAWLDHALAQMNEQRRPNRGEWRVEDWRDRPRPQRRRHDPAFDPEGGGAWWRCAGAEAALISVCLHEIHAMHWLFEGVGGG